MNPRWVKECISYKKNLNLLKLLNQFCELD